MRLLITGGAGSLGSNLIEYFASASEAVLALDNFTTGKRAAVLPKPNLMLVEGSVTDENLISRLFEEFEPTHVVHAAASYKNPLDWVTDLEVNVRGTVNVIRSSERAEVRRFIYLQTALCFGRPSVIPVPRLHPLAPFTSYGITKTAGEAFVAASALPWVSLRLANVTGPRLAIGPIPTFYKRIRGWSPCTVSTAVRDFIDMNDFVSLMTKVLSSDDVGYFNVSSGHGHSIEEVFRLVASHLGQPEATPQAIVHPAPDDVAVMVLDPSETEDTFNWKAEVDFPLIIQGVLDWYDDHGITDVYSHLKVDNN